MTNFDLLRDAAYCDHVFEFVTNGCSEDDKVRMREFLDDGKKNNFSTIWFHKHGLPPTERFYASKSNPASNTGV